MNIGIACSSRDEIPVKYLELATNIASRFAKNSYDLVFGAATTGMMGRCYQEFLNNKRKIYAYTIPLYEQDIQRMEYHQGSVFKNIYQRTEALYDKSDIILVLPGGSGTLSEFACMVEENRSNSKQKPIILLNIDNFYDPLLKQFNLYVDLGYNDSNIYKYFKVVSSVDEIFEYIEKVFI